MCCPAIPTLTTLMSTLDWDSSMETASRILVNVLLLFFFQAEDGIRDFHVTGVQTCALPIYVRGVAVEVHRHDRGGALRDGGLRRGGRQVEGDRVDVGEDRRRAREGDRVRRRSEERRVGKEGKSRRATHQ